MIIWGHMLCMCAQRPSEAYGDQVLLPWDLRIDPWFAMTWKYLHAPDWPNWIGENPSGDMQNMFMNHTHDLVVENPRVLVYAGLEKLAGGHMLYMCAKTEWEAYANPVLLLKHCCWPAGCQEPVESIAHSWLSDWEYWSYVWPLLVIWVVCWGACHKYIYDVARKSKVGVKGTKLLWFWIDRCMCWRSRRAMDQLYLKALHKSTQLLAKYNRELNQCLLQGSKPRGFGRENQGCDDVYTPTNKCAERGDAGK